jgi:hypothetical protein
MPAPHRDKDLPNRKTAPVKGKRGQRGQRDEPLDDEEKILEGHPDVNMPALLTRDVQGG